MPATPARIGFILQEFRKVTVESPGVVTKYGDAARTSDDPVETFFNTTADALAMAQERQDLLALVRLGTLPAEIEPQEYLGMS